MSQCTDARIERAVKGYRKVLREQPGGDLREGGGTADQAGEEELLVV